MERWAGQFGTIEQGMTVVAVRENKNVMKNDLSALPWKSGQFYSVANYWEAAGVISALRAGIAPESVRRPFKYTTMTAQGVPVERSAHNATHFKPTTKASQ